MLISVTAQDVATMSAETLDTIAGTILELFGGDPANGDICNVSAVSSTQGVAGPPPPPPSSEPPPPE